MGLRKSRSLWIGHMASSMTQQGKNLPAMQETQEMRVWSLGQKDPLEEKMATHCSMLAWKVPWTEDLAGYSPTVAKSQHDWATEYESTWTFVVTPGAYGARSGSGIGGKCGEWTRKMSVWVMEGSCDIVSPKFNRGQLCTWGCRS